jgi:hypothetical protein
VLDKTVLRSVRLPKQLEESLVREAESRKMSVNSFIASILAKYNEWDRIAEKFGFVQLPEDNLRSILEAADEQQLARVGKEQGSKVPRQVMNFWFKEVSHNSFVLYLGLYSHYGRLMEYEISQTGRDVTLIVHHKLGIKWSVWLKNYIGEAIRSVYSASPQVESTADTVNFRYQLQ